MNDKKVQAHNGYLINLIEQEIPAGLSQRHILGKQSIAQIGKTYKNQASLSKDKKGTFLCAGVAL